ncbi:putative PKS-like enzyme [Xylaria sp. FL0933]|nr:putative PKS-like enzyme [Xylaria sp. FL0933]
MESGQSVKAILFSHEVLSGELQDLLRKLHRYAKPPHHVQLTRFLLECASVLKQEAQKLPRALRDLVSPFHDVLALASHWDELKDTRLRGTLEGVFLCIYQIAMLIGRHETHGIEYGYHGGERDTDPTCLSGAGIGLFSAAAAAVVRAAFTFCVHVSRVSELLEGTPSSQVETVATPTEVVQAELDRFNGNDYLSSCGTKLRPLTRVSISHVSNTSVGLTGTPALYDAEDIRAILESASVKKTWGSRPARRPLISPYTGDPFPASDAYHLIRGICAEALTKPLYFDKIAEGVAKIISEDSSTRSVVSSCHVFQYRMTQISDTAIDDIMKTLISNSAYEAMSPLNWKLAIVGMACRMPGGANNPQQFWELLMDGKDTHTVVPPDGFDVKAHFDLTGKTESAIGTRFGNFIDNPGFFDAAFFSMSPREVRDCSL